MDWVKRKFDCQALFLYLYDMKTLIYAELSEITPDFWAQQQISYAGKEARVTIQIETETDTTETILRNPTWASELTQAMSEVKQYLSGEPTVSMIKVADVNALESEIQNRLTP